MLVRLVFPIVLSDAKRAYDRFSDSLPHQPCICPFRCPACAWPALSGYLERKVVCHLPSKCHSCSLAPAMLCIRRGVLGSCPFPAPHSPTVELDCELSTPSRHRPLSCQQLGTHVRGHPSFCRHARRPGSKVQLSERRLQQARSHAAQRSESFWKLALDVSKVGV
jgi:hypothetical protein